MDRNERTDHPTHKRMMDQLLALDKELFLFLNGLHWTWLDPVMYALSKTLVWLPLHIFLLFQITKEYKMHSWLVLVGVAVTILFADQTTTTLMKPLFCRPRPSREPELEGLVHLVNGYRGGAFGFASSHAANTFGTAMFLTMLFRNSKPWMAWLFSWAVLVSYTRIYLGVHYPGDIIAGALVGILYGWGSYRIYQLTSDYLTRRRMQSE